MKTIILKNIIDLFFEDEKKFIFQKLSVRK